MGLQAFMPSESFYMCNKCETHIVRECDCLHRVFQNGLFTSFCVFQNLEHVKYSRIINETTVERVHCRYCSNSLGFHYVAQICPIVQNGRSKLSLDRLSYWNGCQRQSGYAPILRELQPGPEPVFYLVPEPLLDGESELVKNSGAAPPRVAETEYLKHSGGAAPSRVAETEDLQSFEAARPRFNCECGQSFKTTQALGSHKYYAHGPGRRKRSSVGVSEIQKIFKSSDVRIEGSTCGGEDLGAESETGLTLFGVRIGVKDESGEKISPSFSLLPGGSQSADGIARLPDWRNRVCLGCHSEFDTHKGFITHSATCMGVEDASGEDISTSFSLTPGGSQSADGIARLHDWGNRVCSACHSEFDTHKGFISHIAMCIGVKDASGEETSTSLSLTPGGSQSAYGIARPFGSSKRFCSACLSEFDNHEGYTSHIAKCKPKTG